MMRRKRNYITMILMVFALFGGVFAMKNTGLAAVAREDLYLGSEENDQLKTESAVNDYAGIYTEEEIASFEEQMKKMRDDYDCNVVAFIIDNSEWNSSEPFAPEQVSEQCLNLDSPKSTVVLWLNINPENRSLYVLGYGSAEHKITNNEADTMAKKLQGYVKRQQSGGYEDNALYLEMMNAFIEDTDTQMRRPYFFLAWWFHLALGILTGGIVVFVLIRNTGGKMTTDGKTYMNKTFSELLGRRDIYTHTTYVRTRKSSSSGGGGGGGHSHSSGGGRF